MTCGTTSIAGVVCLGVLAGAMAWGQTEEAGMTGIVKDPSGSPVASAAVALTNEDSGVTRNVVCDAEGRYRFAAVQPGRYSLRVTATGFKAESLTGIVLNIGTYLEKDVALTVGSVQ